MRFSKKLFPGLLCVGLLLSCSQVRCISQAQIYYCFFPFALVYGCWEHKGKIVIGGGICVFGYGLYKIAQKHRKKTPTGLTDEIKKRDSKIEELSRERETLMSKRKEALEKKKRELEKEEKL